MPLYKRRPFTLLEKPTDLKPEELVFQVRFTKEIFRDYGEYLKRINLYRQRIWTCKFTGKSNLTYEEALVSEKLATEKVQQFPQELVESVLRNVQFSMLTLKDLVNTIAAKLQERLLEGTELYGRKNNRIYPCKIVKVLEEEVEKTQYQVAWLDKDNKVTENAVVNEEDLIRKKIPFARAVLKSFIRESTCRNVPWVLHEKLARKHGISTDPPAELRSKIIYGNGTTISSRKRENVGRDRGDALVSKNGEGSKSKRKKLEGGKSAVLISEKNADKEDAEHIEIVVKYPVDDLLVEPAADDPAFTLRPPPSREFNVPMDCVGDLLMVWDFCSSFSRLLNLSPFSLEDFESALCHKDSNTILIVEAQSAFLRLLIKEEGDYFTAIKKKKRKSKITLITWTEYLCDFLEMSSINQLPINLSTIRRGHYGLLDIHVKLGIFRELVDQASATDFFREKLNKFVEERQALSAANRGEALEEGRKRREAKELSKVDSNGKQLLGGSTKSNVRNSLNSQNKQNGDVAEKQKEKLLSAGRTHKKECSGRMQVDKNLDSDMEKQKIDANVTKLSDKPLSKKGVKVDNNEAEGTRSLEQRKEYLEREMERRVIHTNPLGKDRDYNRYWFFRRDERIFIESFDSGQWGYYSTKDELDSFMGSLNPKGERERSLKKQLEKHYGKICLEIQKRSKEAHRIEIEDAMVRRSTRVRAPPRENPALAFLNYVNKWKED